MHPRQAHHLGPQNLQPRQGIGQTDGFGQRMIGKTAGLRALQFRMNNPGAGACAFCLIRLNPAVLFERQIKVIFVFWKIGNQSSPS
uniref:hypothetical protein n=1 Tax=Fuscibacter oryzae TaxID=2803939 RepID=UPI001F4615B8